MMFSMEPGGKSEEMKWDGRNLREPNGWAGQMERGDWQVQREQNEDWYPWNSTSRLEPQKR